MRRLIIQLICSTSLCFLSLSMGLIYSWPSSVLKLFGSTKTTLDRPMSELELSLLGSLSPVGSLVVTPFAGYLLDRFGRKTCAVLTSLVFVIFWGILAVGNRVDIILTSVFLSGLGGLSYLVVPIYINEICLESIRGTVTSGSMVFTSVGTLLSYLLGGMLDYDTMVYVCLTVSVLGVLMLGLLRESPLLLMKKGLDDEAAKSIAFYRRVDADSKEVIQEMDVIRRSLNPDIDDTPEDEEKLKPKQTTQLSLWKFFKRSQSTRRALAVVLILATASFFQGVVVIQVYADPLFREAVPNMSPTVCSVLFAIVTIVSGLVSAYLIDVAGRRSLLVYSSMASGICCMLLGCQLQLHWAPHVLTAILIYVFCFTYSFGASTIPYVLMVEIFLPEVKSFVSMLVIEWSSVCNFLVLFIFNPLASAIGLGPIFFIFSIICFATALFCTFFLPETKGIPVEAVQMLFVKKNKHDAT